MLLRGLLRRSDALLRLRGQEGGLLLLHVRDPGDALLRNHPLPPLLLPELLNGGPPFSSSAAGCHLAVACLVTEADVAQQHAVTRHKSSFV